MRLIPLVTVAFACVLGLAMTPPADARGGGGNGGGAGMGGGRAGGMPAQANAGGQMTGQARAADVGGDLGASASADADASGQSNQSSNNQLAAALGALNASHASSTALSHASSHSRVGMLAAYDQAMLAALAMPTNTPAEIAARDAAIADARSTLLASAANKPLSAMVVATVDSRLGLPASDPTLGLSP